MKIRAIILAGGEGTRLGVLTAKRTKPAVPFAGKYRIIDFTLSNCVNSNIFDVMIIAQYRPHSLIAHIGAGGPWDLNRDFSGGIRIYTPYRARNYNWFIGTADAVQQNFSFIKSGDPDLILILSGDHIYGMDYSKLIQYHLDHKAELTMATIRVPLTEASRYGIVGINPNFRITSFVEKPENPPSDLANMGVYLFNTNVLDQALWVDAHKQDSAHDFGKNILPTLVNDQARVFAYPYDGYWVDVGTITSYWQAHMDLLSDPPPFNLYDRNWVIHTRTEERPPALIHQGAIIENSMISQGCIIERGARVFRSVLSPGVYVQRNAVIEESIILTDSTISSGAKIHRSVLDKKVIIGNDCSVGGPVDGDISISMVGKNALLPAGLTIAPGGIVGTDVGEEEFQTRLVRPGEYIFTRKQPHEL
ncbi:MAG TPA: glucose-1-phosphate adenylyltransferase [Anaerolineaceae bacterium]